ncbi:MAG: hypothetical protein GSR86_00945 [Desulfurococcales archaeon]|nr:hypothetical protein [Desulfurococcales archaeon]
MFEGVSSYLERRGFNVQSGNARYVSLTGSLVDEARLVAVSSDGLLRITVSGGPDGYRITVIARGSRASSRLARDLEGLGASVDHEEERLLAVFRCSDIAEVRRVLNGFLG